MFVINNRNQIKTKNTMANYFTVKTTQDELLEVAKPIRNMTFKFSFYNGKIFYLDVEQAKEIAEFILEYSPDTKKTG